MCTAIFGYGCFGRTLDLEYSYNETVTVTPRRFALDFRFEKPIFSHYAIIGMATVANGYPLYYDAMNEKGLCIAGLNFPHSTVYSQKKEGETNIASFELIPFILAQCKSVREARGVLREMNICDESFSEEYRATPLHWMVADSSEAIVVEAVSDGVHIYENKVGVLTNEPPFPYQLARISEYIGLSGAEPPQSLFEKKGIIPSGRGLGAVGLPGDFSSPSRFVRAAFVLENADFGLGDDENANQFFRVLGTVEVPRGCVRLENGKNVITHYTSCMNMSRGIYYYKTYGNCRISAVSMNSEDLYGKALVSYPLNRSFDIFNHNFSSC